jgi:NitT/TauT family transport system permease protein
VAPLARRRVARDQLLTVLGGLAGWELVVRAGLVSPLLVAPPSKVLISIVLLSQAAPIRAAFVRTSGEVCVAFLAASVAGILLGVLMARSRFAYGVFHPPLMMLFATPKMIFLPIVILLFGIGFASKAFYGALSGVFPVMVTVIGGVRMIEPHLLAATRSMGASRWQTLIWVIVPGALPSMIAAMWFGLKQALGGVLLAELFISGGQGIGYWITRYTSLFQPENVYALILGLSVIAIVIGTGWRRVEERVSGWRVPTAGLPAADR